MARSLPMDDMNGIEFEFFLVDLFESLGYKVLNTGHSGDFGADLIIQSNTGEKKIIQAKRYSSKVGIRAVQEVSSAKNYYNVHNAAVITNNYFSEPAKKLALSNNIKLIDRDRLNHLITKSEQKRTENNISHKSKSNKKKEFFARLLNI